MLEIEFAMHDKLSAQTWSRGITRSTYAMVRMTLEHFSSSTQTGISIVSGLPSRVARGMKDQQRWSIKRFHSNEALLFHGLPTSIMWPRFPMHPRPGEGCGGASGTRRYTAPTASTRLCWRHIRVS